MAATDFIAAIELGSAKITGILNSNSPIFLPIQEVLF